MEAGSGDAIRTISVIGRCLIGYSAYVVASTTNFGPLSWVVASFSIWTCYAFTKTWGRLGVWDKRHILWGSVSAGLFLLFLKHDQDFKGWGDIYYFCGSHMQYCEPSFNWNLWGWGKAVIMWNFVLSSALGLQKLAIQFGLDGLLPGEEVVTKESFISICWRLIPYWLNKWEQEWGAECSSMMFELPHFAIELLVVLPCVQIICARLKILAMPPGRGVNQGANPPEGEVDPGADLAPCILKGTWEAGIHQQQFWKRLRANLHVLLVVVGIASLAAFNALVVPLRLEHQILVHPRTAMILDAAETLPTEGYELSMMESNMGTYLRAIGCMEGCTRKPDVKTVVSQLRQHDKEIKKMQDYEHMELIPLVEVALAIMRLSCEKFFVLISVFAAYLLFRDEVPSAARLLIRVNHRISTLFQRVILYSFPAVCWIYGAGTIFSLFVSVVFWGPLLQHLYESLRKHTTIVRPMGLEDATEEQIERMNNNCAVCWSEMGPPLPRAPMRLLGASGAGLGSPRRDPGKSLPCGHAFHEACIKKWLAQCHGQGRRPTCPMCNNLIELEVRYRLPFTWRTDNTDPQGVPAVIPALPAAVRNAPPNDVAVAPAPLAVDEPDRAPTTSSETGLDADSRDGLAPQRPDYQMAEQVFRVNFPEPPSLDAELLPSANPRRNVDEVMQAYGIDVPDVETLYINSYSGMRHAEQHHACVMHFSSCCQARLDRWKAAHHACEAALASALAQAQLGEVERLRQLVLFLCQELPVASRDLDAAKARAEACWKAIISFRNGVFGPRPSAMPSAMLSGSLHGPSGGAQSDSSASADRVPDRDLIAAKCNARRQQTKRSNGDEHSPEVSTHNRGQSSTSRSSGQRSSANNNLAGTSTSSEGLGPPANRAQRAQRRDALRSRLKP